MTVDLVEFVGCIADATPGCTWSCRNKRHWKTLNGYTLQKCINKKMSAIFEWDERKALRNLRKHGVAFDDAVGVFADPFAVMRQDRIEGGELRWQTLGMVDGHLVLLVAHTVGETQDNTEVIRIISARRADRKERKRYENQDD